MRTALIRQRPLISIILATHNRRDVLAGTLDRLADDALVREAGEVIVVDNASQEDVGAVARGHAHVVFLPQRRNLGSCAKSIGVRAARGERIVFLDDDSYPRSGCLARMCAHFDADPRLAAAGFTVHLPDGAQECSALPHVFVGCGVGFRAAALRAVGGLDVTFFMQAEEYDLSFRLLAAGYRVEIFGDLAVEHLKSPQSRRAERTTYYDVRNNLRVIARYLPEPHRGVYRRDWIERYRWMAEHNGHQQAFARGRRAGMLRWPFESLRFSSRRLGPQALGALFAWQFVEDRMRQLATTGVREVVLWDVSKNAYAFYRGALAAGLTIRAIADDRLAAPGRRYRGVAVIDATTALREPADAHIISNTSYVHAGRRERELAAQTALPIFNWFAAPPASAWLSGPDAARWLRPTCQSSHRG